jgi:hypothetical protein
MLAAMSGASLLPMLSPVLLVLALASWGGAVWLSLKRRRESWSAFAARNDWSCTTSAWWDSPKIRGRFLGRAFSLCTESRGSGKSQHTVTVLRLELGDTVPPSLHLEPEGLGDKFLKLFGRKDEEVGDKELDAALDLKGVSPEARSILLAPRVRRPLLTVRSHYPRFSIVSGTLMAEQADVADTVDALEALVAPALDLGKALDAVARNPEERVRG